MQFIGVVMTLLGLCALNSVSTVAVTSRNNKPVDAPIATPRNTLAQDLDEVARLINTKDLQRLAMRYLLNDAQFQTFVRIINSHDGYLAQMRFRSQPEVMHFVHWVRTQIMLYGAALESAESNESLRLINRVPFWSQNVFGWQGFVNEFHFYYPEQAIRMKIQTKAGESKEFAQFIERLKKLKVAYDRVIVMPEVKRVITSLEANGIDTSFIDNFIRNQFGWQHVANNVADVGAAQ